MFDIQVGAQLRLSSEKFKDGFFVTGNPGQGKSVMLEQIALELIKNSQPGILVELYGDLSKGIQEHLKSDEFKKHAVFINLKDAKKIPASLKKNKFVVASGTLVKDGARKTFENAEKFMKAAYKSSKKGMWVIYDEAFNYFTEELLKKHMNNPKGNYAIYSASDFLLLSEQERKLFAKKVKNFIIYKPRNLNANLMAKERKELKPETIKAIKQYHFQLLLDGKVTYHQGVFPVKDI